MGGRAAGRVTGGFRLSGRWGWSSGSAHCTWVLLGAIVPGDGYRTFLVPRPDYEIEDTWFVYGLQATGSNDIVIDRAGVRARAPHPSPDGRFQLRARPAEPDVRHSLGTGLHPRRVHAGDRRGTARRGPVRHGNAAASSTDPTKLQGDPDITRRVAEAINDIDEVETILFRNFDRMMELVNAGKPIPMIDRVRYRYQASIVIDRMGAAVDRLFEVAGGQERVRRRRHPGHLARRPYRPRPCRQQPDPFARNLGGMALGAQNGDFFV